MRRVLITGATGFIGGRLAEVTCERGVPTVALVRTWSRAAFLSRLPVEMVHGDILDIVRLRTAMKGCDVVFHCAVDFRRTGKAHRRSSVTGTHNVMRAALEAGVQRVIFLSSIAVYGRRTVEETVNEGETCRHTGNEYGDAKLDAENAALRFSEKKGLPVTILRPTIVYGPFGGYWTLGTIRAIRDGRMVLVNGGTGACNCLYVDNLVDAMLLCALHPHAPGQIFNISDACAVTWKEFIEGHARALDEGFLPLPEMTAQEIEALRARTNQHRPSSIRQTLRLLRDPRIRMALRSIPVVARLERIGRTVATTVLPARGQQLLRETLSGLVRPEPTETPQPVARPLLPRGVVQQYAAKTIFSIDKAKRVLGYEPKVDFAEGMSRTAAWIRWARV